MSVISIPKSYMGTTMQEVPFKAALRELNPELHFDMGACLNLWHPYQKTRQNVFYRGRSLCAMDRGTLPEVPVWTMRKDLVRVPTSEVRPGELALYETAGVIGGCQKCNHVWIMPHRPVGIVDCPRNCGNKALSTDTECFLWRDNPSNHAQVFRQVKDRVILVGWRWTLGKLIRKGIPGVTKATVEEKFKVNLDAKILDEVMVEEDIEGRVLDRMLEVG